MISGCNDNTDLATDTTSGNLETQYQLAQDYLNNKNDVDSALQLLEQIAGQEYTPAQNKLGVLYSNGQYVKKDPLLAFYWYEKAAKNGFTISQYNLAEMYRLGIGTSKDEVVAFQWFQQAAQKGYPLAMLRVAEFYSGGNGIGMDLENAYAWYALAKENGVNVPGPFISNIANQLTEEQLIVAQKLIVDIKREMNINRQ